MSKVEAVAQLFRARPGEWVSAFDVIRVGGALSWRTRISDCRKPPYLMDIENQWDGKESRYRYVGPMFELKASA